MLLRSPTWPGVTTALFVLEIGGLAGPGRRPSPARSSVGGRLEVVRGSPLCYSIWAKPIAVRVGAFWYNCAVIGASLCSLGPANEVVDDDSVVLRVVVFSGRSAFDSSFWTEAQGGWMNVAGHLVPAETIPVALDDWGVAADCAHPTDASASSGEDDEQGFSGDERWPGWLGERYPALRLGSSGTGRFGPRHERSVLVHERAVRPVRCPRQESATIARARFRRRTVRAQPCARRRRRAGSRGSGRGSSGCRSSGDDGGSGPGDGTGAKATPEPARHGDAARRAVAR